MQYLNIIYFLIITFYGYNFLSSDGKIIKGALNKQELYHYSGTELFWCLTFSTGLLAFSANVGLNLMAIRLLVLEILCLIGIRVATNKIIVSFPLKIYFTYLIWLCIGLFYTPSIAYGIRVILKYFYPLLLCLFASAVVRDSEVFFKSSLFARTIGVITIAFSVIPGLAALLIPGVMWYAAARAINYISIMIFSLGMFFFTHKKKQNILYALLFLAPCLIWVLRTSIMGSLVAIMAFFLIRYRIKAVPIIIGIFIMGIVAVFTIPTLKQKMFYDDSVTLTDFKEGKISEDNIDTNARSATWEKLEKLLYNEHKLIGSGTGAVQTEMYSHPRNYGNLIVPHSDFIQQKCDNGLIGLILYGSMIFFIFCHCFKTYWTARSGPLQLCAIVAGASLLGVYATFYSDNTVNYSMATLSMPFGFYGMMLGLLQSEKEQTI